VERTIIATLLCLTLSSVDGEGRQNDDSQSGGNACTVEGLTRSSSWAPGDVVFRESLRGSGATDGTSIFLVNGERQVVAIRAGTGRVKWRRPLLPSADGPPPRLVVAGGHLVVGDGGVTAYAIGDGVPAWRYEDRIGDSPGAFLAQGTEDAVLTGSAAGRIYSLDTRTGKAAWVATVSDDPRTIVFEPRTAGDLVVAGYTTHSRPSVAGVVAVNRRTGATIWNTRLPGPVQGAATVGNVVLTGSSVWVTNNQGKVIALQLSTGAVEWISAATSAEGRADFRSLVLAGDVIVAGSETGVTTAFDIESKAVKWERFYDLGSATTRAAYAAGVVFFPHYSGVLQGIDPVRGDERFRTGDAANPSLWLPLVADCEVYVVTATGLKVLGNGTVGR
jgi:outer membrane protein assembly factor BamB